MRGSRTGRDRSAGRARPVARRRLGWYRIAAMIVALTVGAGAALFAGAVAPVVVQNSTGARPNPHGHGAGGSHRSVVDLVDQSAGAADFRATLIARKARIALTTGQTIDGWTWGGTIPGPQLTVRQDDLVEISVRNEDVDGGVTVHWHGVDVPCAMDGVAGVTQEAILPGHEFVYRFRPHRAGTFWYHTHQNSAVGVGRGLFGALVVLPAGQEATGGVDRVLLAHTWSVRGRPDITTIGLDAGAHTSPVAPGTPVRLRLVNTDSLPQHWAVGGADFTVAAIDGTDVHKPTPLRRATLTLGAGGRYDVTFTMPAGPVVVGLLDRNTPRQVLLPAATLADDDAIGALGPAGPVGGPDEPGESVGGPEFDPLRYGAPAPALAPVPFTMQSRFDVDAVQKLSTRRVFTNGVPTTWWTINGKRAPDIPMIMVEEGQRVRVHIVNASDTIHPMHLHGHHVLVLQRNGVPARGSPWWADTVNLNPGDDLWVAFTADNPGIWMDHCHNLDHQAAGMLMHVGYRAITTPYDHG